MPSPFQFSRTPSIHFGLGKIRVLPELLKPYGPELLVVTGKGALLRSRQWEQLQERLRGANLRCHHYSVVGEPNPQVVDRAVEEFAAENIGSIVAIGGGSVLDAGKAIAAMWGKKESVRAYLEEVGDKEHDGSTLPLFAIPTTGGTGSEATKNAVLSEVGPDGFKRSLRHDHFVPRFAVIDPELAMTVPPEVTARSGMDAFTQLLESYLSTHASGLTDMVAWEGLRYVKRSLLRASREGRDLDARSDMAYAALLSGISLANAGLGTVHGYASSLGGRFPIPHGVVCATLMGPVNRITFSHLSKDSPAFERYANVGALFAGHSDRSRDYYGRFLINLIAEWTEELNIPRLGEFGVTAEDLPAIAENTGNKYNPVTLTAEERLRVLEERL